MGKDSRRDGRDSVMVIIGDKNKQVAVGDNIRQNLLGERLCEVLSDTEMQEFFKVFLDFTETVESALSGREAIEANRMIGRLEDAIRGAEVLTVGSTEADSEAAGIATVRRIRDWFIDRGPAIGAAVIRVLSHPIVIKVAESLMDVSKEEFIRAVVK